MTPTPNERFITGVVAILCASILSSIGWIFEGEAVARLSPLPVVCVASLVGGITLLLGGYIFQRGSISSLRAALSARFALYSIVRSAIISLVFAYCLTLTSSTKMMFLTKIEPYVVLILHIIFHGHRTSPLHLMLLGIHIFGALMLSTGGSFHLSADIGGDLLILAAITANAALYAPSRRYAQVMGTFFSSGLSQVIAGLTLLPFTIALSMDTFILTPGRMVGWSYTVATIVTFYVLSTGLFFFSLKSVPAWLASALRCVGPVIAAPVAWIVFDQPLTGPQTVGALIVVGTSVWMVAIERR